MSNTDFNHYAVPSQGVVSKEEVVWKSIPGYSLYEASSSGFIRLKSRIEIERKGRKAHTTKGYYLALLVLDDKGEARSVGVHRLVCLAFHPLPPDADKVKYEPNHIDGNKINNAASNLEWMTRSQNVLHAFDTGLCQVGVRVEVKNVLTEEVLTFNSLSAAARAFKKPRAELRTIIARHRENPYDGIWLFKIDDSSDKKLKRHQSREVVAKDYVNKTVTIYRDSGAACDATGIKLLTINQRVSPYSKIKNRYELLCGYVFKSLDDKTPFPEYSKKEAQLSREAYFQHRFTKRLEVVDTHLNTTKVYNKIVDFANEIETAAENLNYSIRRGTLYKGRYKLCLL